MIRTIRYQLKCIKFCESSSKIKFSIKRASNYEKKNVNGRSENIK